MPKIASFFTLGFITLDRTSAMPMHRQLYETLRDAILNGRLKPGTRVPPTRAFAKELRISRNTISKAYDQLIAEGYLESLVGSGTHVTHTLPEEMMHVQLEPEQGQPTDTPRTEINSPISERASAVVHLPYPWEQSAPRPFDSASPAVDAFPYKLWEKLLITSWRGLSHEELSYGSALGYQPLREALASYLQAARGVRCTPDQIIITNGAQQAIGLVTNMLMERGDIAWIENPSYPGILSSLKRSLTQIVPVSVDDEGLVVEEGIRKAPNAKLVYISPSHQYPLGATMSLTRRLLLLQWAQESGAWIIEDDYDSEFRYQGYPIASVQGLDQSGCVIYVGTFSKILYPAMRIGYMVVPPSLIELFHAARAHADRGTPLLEQAVLARFLSEGHLARHARRMRTLYESRQALLIDAARRHLSDLLTIEPADGGLHLVGWLPAGLDDTDISERLAMLDIIAPALSSFSLVPLERGGLILGFAAVRDKEIEPAIIKMKRVLASAVKQAASTGPRI